MTQELELPTMSEETIGSSVYSRMPSQWFGGGCRAVGLVHVVGGRLLLEQRRRGG